jgi:hypothetical protein
MGVPCLAENREQPAGFVSRHRPLGEMAEAEAGQMRLALRLRAGRICSGLMVPFDRWPHAAESAGVEG